MGDVSTVGGTRQNENIARAHVKEGEDDVPAWLCRKENYISHQFFWYHHKAHYLSMCFLFA